MRRTERRRGGGQAARAQGPGAQCEAPCAYILYTHIHEGVMSSSSFSKSRRRTLSLSLSLV